MRTRWVGPTTFKITVSRCGGVGSCRMRAMQALEEG